MVLFWVVNPGYPCYLLYSNCLLPERSKDLPTEVCVHARVHVCLCVCVCMLQRWQMERWALNSFPCHVETMSALEINNPDKLTNLLFASPSSPPKFLI